MSSRSPSALPSMPFQRPSTPSRRPSTPLRSPSVLSIQSPTRGSFFICRHEPAASRLNSSLMRFSLDQKTLGTKKCYECQTSTAAGTLNLISAMTLAPDVDKIDPNMVKQAAQLLFERIAGQRRKIENGFKDQWGNIELAFATFCYNHIPAAQLSNICQTVRTRFGAGVDRQLLRALSEAACRENKVWEYVIDPTEPTVYTTLNAYIQKLREGTELIERFTQVQEMFKNAEALGRLSIETVTILSQIDSRLQR
ncbi:hypothetical protein GGR58DRAFT_522183 [Xylaria digitata]|nr:hypothetical protein GGR58DRAFT_522183 [Xylaria digitata]